MSSCTPGPRVAARGHAHEEFAGELDVGQPDKDHGRAHAQDCVTEHAIAAMAAKSSAAKPPAGHELRRDRGAVPRLPSWTLPSSPRRHRWTLGTTPTSAGLLVAAATLLFGVTVVAQRAGGR